MICFKAQKLFGWIGLPNHNMIPPHLAISGSELAADEHADEEDAACSGFWEEGGESEAEEADPEVEMAEPPED